MPDNLIITEFTLRSGLNILMEEDVEGEISNLRKRADDTDVKLGDDVGRVSYIRQLTAELLDYMQTLNAELRNQVEIPASDEMMEKLLGRKERKRYYLSKFRL